MSKFREIYLFVIIANINMVIMTNEYSKRPFYNIAHMANSIKEVDKYLALGANAIEADITFSSNGTPISTYHGFPCDCFRRCLIKEDFPKYLAYIRDISTPGNPKYKKNLALLFLDLKITGLSAKLKAVAGQRLAEVLNDHLFNNKQGDTRVKLLLHLGQISDTDFIIGFENELKNRGLSHLNDIIGWDVGFDVPFHQIENMWKRLGRVENIWLGDGLTNCLSPFLNSRRLREAVKRRDGPDNFMDKVYHWTIDLTSSLRLSLRIGVDGIITNHPDRLLNVLREKEFVNNFRLATQEDNPYLRFEVNQDQNTKPAKKDPISKRIGQGFKDVFMSARKYARTFS